MNEAYTEISLEIIKVLIARGYHSVRIVARDDKSGNHSTIELIPMRSSEFQLDLVLLDSPEILTYIGHNSPMVKFIVNRAFLPIHSSS